jgi:hypothetical protein
MTVVSNDPIWWPAISLDIVFSYVTGSWRAIIVAETLTLGLQLDASWWYYMIGVRKIMPTTGEIIDVTIVFSSSDIRTRGRLM